MVSISAQTPLCQGDAPSTSPGTPDVKLVRQFWDGAKRQVITGDYLRRKWQPLYGPRFATLVKALRAHCSYAIKEGEAMCFPSEETLAAACGVSRRTILYWLKRDEQGRFIHPRHGKALQQFLRIQPKLRYDPVGQRSLKSTHRYFIRMDDPPVPEDEPLIWARAYELAQQSLACQAEEQEREVCRERCEARAAGATPFDPTDCARNNAQTLHYQQCAMLAHNRPTLTPLPTSDVNRTRGERRIKADDVQSRDEEKTLVGGMTSALSDEQQAMREGYKRTGPAPQVTKQSEETPRTPFNLTLLHAERTTGGVLADLLREAGDPTPAVGMRTILMALVDAGAPLEKLVDLVYLGRNRVRRFLARGGRIKTTLPGFYINLMRNLANEAKGKRWDTALIELEDQIKHEEALRRIASRGVGTPQEQQAPADLDQETLDEEKAAPEGTAAAQSAREEESPLAEGEANREPLAFPAQEAAPTAPEADAEDEKDETWIDALRPTIPGVSGHQGNVGLLWGFVRETFRARSDLGFARKQHLEALLPAVDPTNPSELILLSTSESGARFLEATLLREIEAQREKLLYHVFDEVRVQYAARLPVWAQMEGK